MKLCLICGNESTDSAATCPNCGHASWGKALGGHQPAVTHPPVETRPQPAAEPQDFATDGEDERLVDALVARNTPEPKPPSTPRGNPKRRRKGRR